MGKPNKTQVLIQQELKTRQSELAQIEGGIQQREQELSALTQARLKTIGAIEQLKDLEK